MERKNTQLILHKNRAILGISGPDAATFLQGTITQDIHLLADEKPLYSAHLTPQGKFLFDFFIAQKGHTFLIECEKNALMPLATALHKYVVDKKVTFDDLSTQYAIVTAQTPLDDGFQDPRHTDMGYRAWINTGQLPEHYTTNTDNYTHARIQLLIPEGDAISGKTLINELDFERLNGVSFQKGCYVGQELTARTKFRTTPQKKLVHVTFDKHKEFPPQSIIHTETKSDAGWLFTHFNGAGIALIRTRYLEKGISFYIEDTAIHIT